MYARLFVKLADREAAALCRLAAHELRQPGEQARALLRQALCERGFLHDANEEEQATEQAEAVGDA